MDTRRCLRCHKLLRADAQKCSRCGYVFLQAPVKRSSNATNESRQAATALFPSNSPASPHRAGHYSGLHPEDQPYQSSFMPILRPSVITRRLAEQESEDAPEQVAVSTLPEETHETEEEPTPKRHVATPVATLAPMPQRSTSALSKMDTPAPLFEVEPLPFVPEQTLHQHTTAPLPIPDERQPRHNIARMLFIAAILSFLLASSILTYLLVFAGTGAPAHPAAKVVHTANQQGQAFAPQLQLSASHLDFGTVNAQNSLTLTNAGGQQVNWQAGVYSNSSWLSITPTFGTFAKQEVVTVSVNRGNLAPQVYTGYINFFQQGSYTPLTLRITMSVTTLPVTVTAGPPPISTAGPLPAPAMTVTTTALTFNAILGKKTAQQAFTLANPGNAPLDWAIVGDANATAYLSVSPKSGTVAPGSSVAITVTPNILTAPAGTLNAVLTIKDTDPGTVVKSQQVAVKITISNRALISVSTTNISCNLSSTVTTSSQPLNITNSGSATLNWTVLSQPLPSWISVDTTSGQLPPGYTAFVNVACNNTGFQAGFHTSYTLVVSDTDVQTPVAPQNVVVTLTVT